MNQIQNNFENYEDFQIFESDLHPTQTPPLRLDQTYSPYTPKPLIAKFLPPPADYEEPDINLSARNRDNERGDPNKNSLFIFKLDIDKAMKENFEYEKKAVDQLFHKYEAYKPIVSGIYGQNIVESTEHLQTQPVRNMVEYYNNFELNE